MSQEERIFIPPLGADYIFPNPRFASKEGLLAYGGDLSPNRLLMAYRKGIFPWYSQGDPILWWSPDPRLLLEPKSFKVSKSFRKILKKSAFEVQFDRRFREVLFACANTPRKNQHGTWLLPAMQEAYTNLHEMGFAHSVEVLQDGVLVGGLYGVAIGKGFFGESMFSHVSNGSKIALKALSDVLAHRGYDFIDCQLKTEYLVSLGAFEVSRDIFLDRLQDTLAKPTDLGLWQHFSWEYKDDR